MKKSYLATLGFLFLVFICIASVSAATITVTSPNGGESWQPGTSHKITWDYTGNPGSLVKIVLLKGGVEVGTATYGTSVGIGTVSGGSGSFNWQISSTRAPGSDYQILVQSTTQPTVKDTSNGYFTITPAGTTAPSRVVTISGQNVLDDTGVDLPAGFTIGQCGVIVSPYQFYCPENTFLSEFYSFYSSGGSDTRIHVGAIGYCTTLNSNTKKQTASGRSNYLIICHT